jgi:urease accessory protein
VLANASGDTDTPAGTRWQAEAWLELERPAPGAPVRFQAGARAPLKWQRGRHHSDGSLELPLLHTAGGLVGGDRLLLRVHGRGDAQALLTSVAAQKVYGSVGRFRQQAGNPWSRQELQVTLDAGSWLEWMPQELVMYADALLEQRLRVRLAEGASFLCTDVVRLGRSAAGETLNRGCWRSRLEICRQGGGGRRWELVDALSLDGTCLQGEHGMAGWPVFGSLVWVAPCQLDAPTLGRVLEQARRSRGDLQGDMACGLLGTGLLGSGLVARYRGPSSQAARHWFTRIWAAVRQACGQPIPELPRVWPFQEQPLAGFSPAEPA